MESLDYESEDYGCVTHEMLYGKAKGFCRACNWLLPSHKETCPCSKIRPSVLVLAHEQGMNELRKNFIRQRIFKSDNVRSPQRGSSRKPSTRPKPVDGRELKFCVECQAQRVSRWNGTRWQCIRCVATS